ncbi:hypothetical protein ACJIZ3_000911 [Penstemon smallii]|uniref:Uncharacterized protein n=1 Tax=Penstemon smallii TaxID=265156 RepID=A0ABD3U4U6_9LAMI
MLKDYLISWYKCLLKLVLMIEYCQRFIAPRYSVVL